MPRRSSTTSSTGRGPAGRTCSRDSVGDARQTQAPAQTASVRMGRPGRRLLSRRAALRAAHRARPGDPADRRVLRGPFGGRRPSSAWSTCAARSIPAVDLRVLVGLPTVEYALETPMIICHTGGELVALLVDEVEDVVELPAGCLQELPRMHALSAKMLGVCRLETVWCTCSTSTCCSRSAVRGRGRAE